MSQSFVIKCFFVLLLFVPGIVSANDNLYFFVFKEGVAQKNIKVKVGEIEAITDDFGFANFSLPAGFYEVSYFEGDKIFAITDINLFESLQSQIFLNLYRTGAQVDLDIPLAEYQQDFNVEEVKTLDGPKGRLVLKLTNARDNAPVIGAKLFFRGYDLEALSNANGIIDIEIPEGTYDASVIHPNYILNIIKDISVTRDKLTEQLASLTESEFVLEDYVVTAPFVEGSLASTISNLKDSDVILDTLSSEQISKSGDSSAASAVRRLPGITIVDDKFVCIRGLCERYNNILMNDLIVPSSDPTKRVVPLDIFPTSVIDSLLVQKTFSSDLPATFAGGTVLIDTQGIPKEDNYISGKIGISVTNNLGEEAEYSSDNASSVPQILLDLSENFSPLGVEVLLPGTDTVISEGISQAEADALYDAMVNYRNFGTERNKIEPGTNVSFDSGQRFKLANGWNYGFTAGFFFKTAEDLRLDIERNEFLFSQGTSTEQTDRKLFQRYKLEEDLGIFFGFGFEPSDANLFNYTFLNVDKTIDTTLIGFEEDLFNDDQELRTFLQYIEENLQVHQITGEHKLGQDEGTLFDNIDVSWAYQLGEATRLEPGTFEYSYLDGAADELELDESSLIFQYSDLNDQVDNLRIDFDVPFRLGKRKANIKFGYFDYLKSRNLDNRRFTFDYDINSGVTDPIDDVISNNSIDAGILTVQDNYRPDDFYEAEEEIQAFYFLNNLEFGSIELSFGARSESSTQTLSVGEDEDEFELTTDDVFPFFSATYNFSDELRLRSAYSQTINRPDFREFSPNRFIDTLTDNLVFGNPELEAAYIDNFDLSLEWFFGFDEFFKISAFAKEFTDPIETVRDQADVRELITFTNAESASNQGIEFNVRKNLGKNFFLDLNHTIIDSEVTLTSELTGDRFVDNLTSLSGRPLQGSSPYVTNVTLGYDNFFTKRSVFLLYNIVGERIVELGIDGNPDVYEQPFGSLDLVAKYRINDTFDQQRKKIGYSIEFKATNLLDNSVEYQQGDQSIFRFAPGQKYTLSFGASF